MKNFILILLASLLVFNCTSVDQSNTETNTNVISSESDTLAFEITSANNIIFKTILNETDSLDLYLDTGGTELVMKHSAIKEKTELLLNGKSKQPPSETVALKNPLKEGVLS